MLVQVEVPQGTTDNKMFVKDNQEVKPDSSNDIRSLLVIALHDPDESLKLYPRYNWCLHHPLNE